MMKMFSPSDAFLLTHPCLTLRQPWAYAVFWEGTWCVIDRDEHPIDRYRRAFELAKNYDDVTVIWGNECFELWYLLHFCYRDTPIGRAELRREISKPDRLNRKYEKSDDAIFALLKEKLPDAQRNATRLLRFNPSPMANPSTNIHQLVERLLALQAAANS